MSGKPSPPPEGKPQAEIRVASSSRGTNYSIAASSLPEDAVFFRTHGGEEWNRLAFLAATVLDHLHSFSTLPKAHRPS